MDATVLILIVAVIAALVLIGVGLYLSRRPKGDPLQERLAEYGEKELPSSLEDLEMQLPLRDRVVGGLRERFNDLFSAPVKPQKQLEDVLNQPLSNAPFGGGTAIPDQEAPPRQQQPGASTGDAAKREAAPPPQASGGIPPAPPAVAPPKPITPVTPAPAAPIAAGPPPPAPPPRPAAPITTPAPPSPEPEPMDDTGGWAAAFEEDDEFDAPEPAPADRGGEGGEDPFSWVEQSPPKSGTAEEPAKASDMPDWLRENVDQQAEASPESSDWLLDEDEAVAEIPDWLTDTLSEAKEVDQTPVNAEPVQFAAYYPKEVAPEAWQPLHAYIYKALATAQVEADAAQKLGDQKQQFRGVRGVMASLPIEEGALVTATPHLPGFQFNPPSVSLGFYKDWHRFDFELRAKGAPLHQSANGAITFTVEGILVADVPLSVYVGDAAPETAAPQVRASAKAYQAIFCSYSHQDAQIVARAERAYKALGLDYLRDVISLKSGQDWSVELINLIEKADVFQLFWSRAAAESKHVRFEWEHALKVHAARPGFIRPVYWQDNPQPPIPTELNHIHFAYQPDLEA